eukprot:s182_g5.t1
MSRFLLGKRSQVVVSGHCLATACDDTGNSATLGGSSTAWVDMCKAVPSTTAMEEVDSGFTATVLIKATKVTKVTKVVVVAMAFLRIVLVATCFASAFGGACTPVDSCPKLSDGLYCPVNDVTEHADINRDVKLIKELPSFQSEPDLAQEHLAANDYTSAKAVYTGGSFSSKGGGIFRTLQALAQKDMTVSGKYTNVFFSGALDLYGSIDGIWHNYIIACLDNTGFCAGVACDVAMWTGHETDVHVLQHMEMCKSHDFKSYVINKCLIGVVTAYVTYELGAAVWKAGENMTADDEAAYAWDEAAAFHIGNIEPVIGDGYTGKAPGNLYSPYEFNWKRDDDFDDGLSTHAAAPPALNFGLLNVRGTYNAANVASAQLAMYKIYSIAAIRSALKYANKAYNNGMFQEKYLAEGWAYWRSASGAPPGTSAYFGELTSLAT